MMSFGVEFAALNFLMLKSFISNYCMQDNVVGLSFFNSSNVLYSENLSSFLGFDLKNTLRDSMQQEGVNTD